MKKTKCQCVFWCFLISVYGVKVFLFLFCFFTCCCWWMNYGVNLVCWTWTHEREKEVCSLNWHFEKKWLKKVWYLAGFSLSTHQNLEILRIFGFLSPPLCLFWCWREICETSRLLRLEEDAQRCSWTVATSGAGLECMKAASSSSLLFDWCMNS